MKALTWQGTTEGHVEEVPDPVLEKPTDAIVKITSTAICGSDLHLYELFGPYLDAGDILGHEPMGVVVEVGAAVTHSPSATASSSRSTSPAALLHVQARAAVPVRDDPGARVRERGGTVRLHEALRAGARGTGRIPPRSARGLQPHPRWATTCPMTGTSSSATSSRPHGRGSSMRTCPRAAPWPSWAWARSGSSSRGSACIADTACWRWIPSPSGVRWPSGTAW